MYKAYLILSLLTSNVKITKEIEGAREEKKRRGLPGGLPRE